MTRHAGAPVRIGAMESSSTTAAGGGRREATRQKLYEAAVTLIAEQGFSATTVDEIAERAGVAKGTVYYNFASKSVLFEELLRHGVGLLTASLREAAEGTARDGGSKVDALDAMIRAGLVFIDRYPAFTQLYVAELWRTNRAWQSTLMVVRQQAVAVVEGVLRDAVAEGELSDEIDIPLTAAALVGMVLVAALDWQAFQPERSWTTSTRRSPGSSRDASAAGADPSGDGRPPPTNTRRRRSAAAASPAGPANRRLRRAPPCVPRQDPVRSSSGLPRASLPPSLPAEGAAKGACSVPPPRVGGTGAAPPPCLHSLVPAGRNPSVRLLISTSGYGYSGLRTDAQDVRPPSGYDRVRVRTPLVFTSGWASGINAYAVVLLLGIFGATGLTDEVPETLQRPEILITVGVLFLFEAVADKIPYVDSVWDSVHTVVRPAAGAWVGALLAGQSGSVSDLWAGVLGGSTALASHTVKAGTRMAINTSPEPFSNFVMSTAEDLGVAGILTFAMFHPEAAAIIAAVLLFSGLVVVYFLVSRIRRFMRRRAQRREERRLAERAGQPPDRTGPVHRD